MILFGTAVTDVATYDRFAAPGIRLAAEPDSEIVAHQSTGSLFRNYNLLLDQSAARDDLDALVLVHQDAEIVDPDFSRKMRAALNDPDVAIVGCAGAVGVRGIAWWEGAVTWASFTHRYEERGGGEFPSFSWTDAESQSSISRTGEVDTIDGFVMGISPWAVSNLRFDESLGTMHGYDFDFCMQARAAGKRVVTADLRVVHHHSLDLIENREAWIEAHIRVAEKWDGHIPTGEPATVDWRSRALRAEAEAGAARGEAISERLQRQATERELTRVMESRSWRLTAPLRWPRRALRRGR
jgi:Glycosyltransferase like family